MSGTGLNTVHRILLTSYAVCGQFLLFVEIIKAVDPELILKLLATL